MKKLVYLLFSLSITFSCSQADKNATTTESESHDSANPENHAIASMIAKDTAIYALSFATAQEFTNRYKDYIESESMTYPTSKSFTIRASTLLQALGLPANQESAYTHVRVYLGMDGDHTYKLLFTPVENADIDNDQPGIDVILSGNYKNSSKDLTDSTFNGKYILDFNRPCPNMCGESAL